MTTPGSNPPPPLPPTAGDNKSPIFSKFIRRASRALKSRSIASSGEIGLPAPNVESKSMTTPRPLAGAARNAIPVRETLLRSIAPTDRTYTSSTQYLKLREEKARALFEKYGMNLSPEEWTSPSTGKTQWVEKKIVMRVHRQCHRCQTTFGRDKICFQCQHTRCKKCPRYPLKMTGEKMGIARFDIDYSVLVDPLHDAKLGIINTRRLTVQTKSGREAVRKQVTQRVRRTCHRCEKLFMGKATACDGCQHQRCPKCPRDPPKQKKWPNGYPGDTAELLPLVERVRKPIRLRYRWECHTCQKYFIEHEKKCRGCGHDRCDVCVRIPPKKTKKQIPEQTMKAFEEKIGSMSLRPGMTVADAST